MAVPKTMADFMTLLDTDPAVIALIDDAQYIPIGIVEQTLDKLSDNWGTTTFKFQIINIGSFWFYDASASLYIELPEKRGYRRMAGAVTVQIDPFDNMKDYSGAALSYCIRNAAMHLGKIAGRSLNRRLEIGEAIPVVSVMTGEEVMAKEDEVARELEKATAEVQAAKTKTEAQEVIRRYGFRFNKALQNIANSKPQ